MTKQEAFFIYMYYQNISKNPLQHNIRKRVEQNGKKWQKMVKNGMCLILSFQHTRK